MPIGGNRAASRGGFQLLIADDSFAKSLTAADAASGDPGDDLPLLDVREGLPTIRPESQPDFPGSGFGSAREDQPLGYERVK